MLNRRAALAILLGAPIAACESIDPALLDMVLRNAGPLGQGEAAAGIRAALSNGVRSALGIVGQFGGFSDDRAIHIPLPGALQDLQEIMRNVGAGGMLGQLETRLNRGAEKAAPMAKTIFIDAVTNLSVPDAIGIVRGPQNAATEYLKRQTTPALTQLFNPIMQNALSGTGALQMLDDVGDWLHNVPFAPKLAQNARGDLITHGVTYGLSGVFHYIGKEEAAIRADPVKRTSEILRRVFGNA